MKQPMTPLFGCAALYVLLFLLAGWLTGWDISSSPAPHSHLFNALTLLTWVYGLYVGWTGRWRREDGLYWGVLVLLAALPHIPLAMGSYGSWFCLAGACPLGTGRILKYKVQK